MAFVKGQSGNPAGRPKGSVNNHTADIKRALAEATKLAGNAVDPSIEDGQVAYFRWLAINHPATFGSLVGKTVPTKIEGDEDNPLHIAVTRIELVAAGVNTAD
jgi:hypothetical protein